MLKSQRSLCVAFSMVGAGLCIYHLLVWSIYVSYIFPNESPYRPSRVSPYNPYVLICCLRLLYDWWFHLCHLIACICYFVLSIIALIWLVLMALSCAAIKGDSISILIFYFQFSSKFEVLILLLTFFQFYSVVSQDSNVENFANPLFLLLLLINIWSGLLAEIGWSICMSKSHRSLCVSFSMVDAGSCIYHY